MNDSGVTRGGEEASPEERALLLGDRANLKRLAALERGGVRFPQGVFGVYVGPEVQAGRIEAGVSIFPGARVTGAATILREGASIGRRGPCVLDDAAVGRGVSLGSGVFEKSVLLDGVRLGDMIRVRERCLLEEGCELSFSVDAKHTFLLAYVVLGSEINFCDLLMAGGTGRNDHSEVGSGVIHFNFTPFGKSGDKVTASMIGDVVRGVFYRSRRIFIGGHASLIGPLRAGYGAVLAAGCRADKDLPEDTLSFSSRGAPEGARGVKNFDFLCYKSIRRKVEMGVAYAAQLAALWHWYDGARRAAARSDGDRAMLEACLGTIAGGIETRIDRMDTLCGYMDESIARNLAAGREGLALQQRTFKEKWPAFREKLVAFRSASVDQPARDGFLEALERRGVASAGKDFPVFIREALGDQEVEQGVRWLQSIVSALCDGTDALAPLS